MINIAVPGVSGRMGMAVAQQVLKAKDLNLATATVRNGNALAGTKLENSDLMIITELSGTKFDVLIDFTLPVAVMEHVQYCLKHKIAMVIGATGFDEEQLEKIITQKWIACWPEGMEAWTEQRRTGYPKLFKVQTNNSNGTIDTDIMIRRLPFSQDDAKKDPEQYKNLCTALGGADNGGTRLWWDTGKNNF